MKKILFLSLLLIFCSVPIFADDDGIDRRNISDDLANPRRVKTDNLFYVKLGYGSFLSTFDSYGTCFGLGYRYEIDQVAVDVSFANILVGHEGNRGLAINYVRLQGLYFISPLSNSSFYLGGGLGYGSRGIENDEGDLYTSHSLEGIATIGFETMRVSTVRLFFQVDATFPFKDIEHEGNTMYASTISVSMGIGY